MAGSEDEPRQLPFGRLTEALASIETQYRTLVETASDAIITIDAELRVVSWNPAAGRMFGHSPQEMIGQPMLMIMPKRFRKGFLAAMASLGTMLASSNVSSLDRPWAVTGLRKDGSEFPVEISVGTWSAGGDRYYTAIVRDVTEQVRLREEMHELYEQEKARREELEEERRARGQFINVLAHELRTPLTPLIASAGLLCDLTAPRPESNEHKLASLIMRSARALASRLDELLDLGRSAAGTFTASTEEVDMKALLEDAVQQCKQMAIDKEQSLVLEAPQGPLVVLADAARIEQVVANLLSNANKLGPTGSTITVRARIVESELVVEVEDQGTALSTEEQARLLKPYHRTEQDRQRFPGLGLGLAVSRQIIDAHQGRFWVESHSHGNKFCFSLPLSSQAPTRSACGGRDEGSGH